MVGKFNTDTGHHWNVIGQSPVFVNRYSIGQLLKILGQISQFCCHTSLWHKKSHFFDVSDQTSQGSFLSLIEQVKFLPPEICVAKGPFFMSLSQPSNYLTLSLEIILVVWNLGAKNRQGSRLMYDRAPQAKFQVSDYTNNITYFPYHFISNSEESLMINSN